MMSEFEVGKEYVTRAGLKVRIYAVDGAGNFPIHGAWTKRDCEQWTPASWTERGTLQLMGESNLDLVLPKKTTTVYLYLFEDGSTICEATPCSDFWGHKVIAMKKVEITEGQFETE